MLCHAPLQAVKGFTITSLKSRLKRHGVVVDKRYPSRVVGPNGLPPYLDLSNLCATAPSSSSSAFQPPLYLSVAHPDIDAALGEGPDGQVATRTRSIHVSWERGLLVGCNKGYISTTGCTGGGT